MREKITSKIFLLAIIALIAISCGGRNKQSENDIITINVSANFPTKELILQDFMNVEYIALDDADEFITQGRVLDIGKRYILITNWGPAAGNIFVFDRKTGEGLRVINRRGQGAEEYANIVMVTLDEENGEIFVRDDARRILVYDLYGNFRRRFELIGDTGFYRCIFNYDPNNLLVYKAFPVHSENSTPSSFLIISKKDGSLVREIDIPAKEFRTPIITRYIDGRFSFVMSFYPSIIPYRDGWALMQASSDTIYHLLPNGDLTPLITRTPSIHSMRTELFLFPSFFTDRYYFMQVQRRELRETHPISLFPRTNLVYDRQKSTIFRVTVYNDDFSNRRSVDIGDSRFRPVSHEIAFFKKFEAYQLVEAYENGELRGRLKEIASTLNEESNPVIMIVTHKN